MSLYRRKDSEVWWLDIRHGGHRVRRSTGETDRAAAEAKEREALIELWTAVPVVDEHTWGEACSLWLDAEPRSTSELLSLAKFTRSFPDRGLSACTAEAIEEALSFCKTAGTYMRYRNMLLAILHRAQAKRWITEVPVIAVRRDKKRGKTRDWLTPEQWTKLYAALPAHQKAPASFAIETGLRQANVFGLTWARVSIERRLVWVEAEDAKGGEAIPVPLNDRALEVLKAQAGQHDTHVFVYKGKPMLKVRKAFVAACVKAGLGEFKDGSYVGFTWHGFRHTWATWHMQNGTDILVLQKLGGWADIRMVQVYAHHAPSHLAGFAGNNRKGST